MIPLPIANILHHRLRSALSALGVAIGVCMLVTLAGLSRGSVGEIADRWEAVKADLLVFPTRSRDNLATINGGGLTARDADFLRNLSAAGETPATRYSLPRQQKLVDSVTPVFIYNIAINGKNNNVVGVLPEDLPALLGAGPVQAGQVFDPGNESGRWLAQKMSQPEGGDIAAQELAEHHGQEMVVDSRLAKILHLQVGSKVQAAGREFTVTGIAPEGALVRAFIPLATAQHLFDGALGKYTVIFVKLRPGVLPGEALRAIRDNPRLSAISLTEYRAMFLRGPFGMIYLYVDVVNTVVLIVAFLFVLVTLHTTVIQRTREIAILRSMGATRWFIMRQVMWESLILTAVGTLLGIGLSLPAGWAIQFFGPDLTVAITWHWIMMAAGAAGAGALLAALYPAWYAMRIDVVEALNLE